jgi:Domain of Unknown Function (DUF1080)
MRHFLLPFALAFSLAANALAGDLNTLTDAEKSTGWKLLFDGKTLNGWQPIGKAGEPIKGWAVKDGVIFHGKAAGGGDIVTVEQFGDFELTWEWKISEGGNSGLKYNLPDAAKGVGFEYQLLDDAKHPDARVRGTRRQSGALYDLYEPAPERKVKPVGEWNESRVVVKGDHVEQWLNGVKTVEFDFGSDDLKERIAGSKYKGMANFGVKAKSPILLQDHGDEVSFRNLKLRVPAAK